MTRDEDAAVDAQVRGHRCVDTGMGTQVCGTLGRTGSGVPGKGESDQKHGPPLRAPYSAPSGLWSHAEGLSVCPLLYLQRSPHDSRKSTAPSAPGGPPPQALCHVVSTGIMHAAGLSEW